jgi:hypothetical protein
MTNALLKKEDRTEDEPAESLANEAAPHAAADAAGAPDEDEDEARDAPESEGAETPTMWSLVRDYYFTFDRRTLGFTRLLLGFYLIMDLVRHAPSWMDMYSTQGVLPTHVNLFRPQANGAFSIFNAFSTPGELGVLWALMFVTFVCLFIGYKTKVAQVLSLVFLTGMNGRVLLIENGGYVVQNLLLMWTCFLPLGDRFSLDAMLASLKRRREASAEELNDRSDVLTPEEEAPHISVLGLVLMIQLSAIYFFNVLHKTGPAWKNGTAVHYVLYVDRMVTPIVGQIRDYAPNVLILVLTKMTLAFEATIPVALLSPLGRVWSRRVAIVMINTLHIGFGTAMVLGPFAWACCVFSTLLFSTDDWEIAGSTMRREHRARTVLYDPRSAGALLVCRILKRLDRFELLTFREAQGIPLGIAVERPDGATITRAAALADIVAALPLGPTLAWILRAPFLRSVFDAAMAWIEVHDVSRFFGLRLLPSHAEEGPSPVRRGGRHALAFLREVAILVMFASALNQAAVELWVINRRVKVPQPEPLRILAHKMRFLQGWFMFSPNPVMDDGTIVVDAITIDGRHIDPFTNKEPDFDLLHAKSFGYNQIWSDYYNRMHQPGNAYYRDAMKEYMLRFPKRTGRPEDTLVSGDVYWVQDMNPRWNDTESYKYERLKLFSFDNPAAKPLPSNQETPPYALPPDHLTYPPPRAVPPASPSDPLPASPSDPLSSPPLSSPPSANP